MLFVREKKIGWASLVLPVVLLGSQGCSVFKPGFVSEASYEVKPSNDNAVVDGIDGPTGGHFDEDGNWIPDNPDIPLTYKLPDISAGFIFDAKSLDVTPSIQVELLEIDTHIPYINTLKLDLGAGHKRTFVYVGKLWSSIFEISTGLFAGWNWDDNDISFGVGCTIIRF